MKLAVFALALLGAIIDTLLTLVAIGLTFGSFDSSDSSRRFVLGFGASAIAASVAGVIFASLYLAGKWPRLMAAGLALAVIWHFVSLRIMELNLLALLGGYLMLLAALLAIGRELLGARRAGTPHATITGDQA